LQLQRGVILFSKLNVHPLLLIRSVPVNSTQELEHTKFFV